MIANIHPETGIRYGAISGNSIDPDVLDGLWDRADAAISFAAEETRRVDLKNGLLQLLPAVDSCDLDGLIDQQVEYEQENDYFCSSEPSADIEYQGVHLHFGYLGGAVLLIVTESPCIVYVNRLCSPCVPNAGDLDSGTCEPPIDDNGYYKTYGVPADWLNDKER